MNVIPPENDYSQLQSRDCSSTDKRIQFESDLSIDVLGLSVRSYNALVKHGIKTVRELLSIDDCSLLKIRNLGVKSLNEIKFVRSQVSNGTLYNMLFEKKSTSKLFFDYPPTIKVSEIQLSTRLRNVLTKLKVSNLEELMSICETKLLDVEASGTKTLKELKEIKSQFQFFLFEREQKLEQNEKDNFYLFISKLNLLTDTENQFLENFISNTFSIENCIWDDLIKSNIVLFYTYKKIISLIKRSSEKCVNKELLYEILYPMPDKFVDELLVYFHDKIQIKISDSDIFLPSVEDVISLEKNDELKDILLERLYGFTLEEVGNKYNLTRERIRQKVSSWSEFNISRIINTNEGVYQDYYEKYNWKQDRSLFFEVLNAPEFCINLYENIICIKSGEFPLENLMEDPNISIEKKLLLEQKLKRNEIKICGKWCKRNLAELTKFYLRHCTDKNKSYSFQELYENFSNFIVNISSFPLYFG